MANPIRAYPFWQSAWFAPAWSGAPVNFAGYRDRWAGLVGRGGRHWHPVGNRCHPHCLERIRWSMLWGLHRHERHRPVCRWCWAAGQSPLDHHLSAAHHPHLRLHSLISECDPTLILGSTYRHALAFRFGFHRRRYRRHIGRLLWWGQRLIHPRPAQPAHPQISLMHS
jgi:hypothetical protein